MIWALCHGSKHLQEITIKPWRVVEAQHVLSTRDLVDSREEHDLLEELIESSKPLIEQEKNYLIFTPFRYPPLKYGSRFGTSIEPSLWYGSLELETAFTEVAYYRLKFFEDTDADLGYIELSMTAFTAYLHTERGIDLTREPFNEHTDKISDKYRYEDSQQLGGCMRADDIHAFLYRSARAPESTNVAAFTPSVFHHQKNQFIHNLQNWTCFGNKRVIEFSRRDRLGAKIFTFPAQFFC